MRVLIQLALVVVLTGGASSIVHSAPPMSVLLGSHQLTPGPGPQRDPFGIGDDQGGALLAWVNEATGPEAGHWFALRLTPDGRPYSSWPANGVPLIPTTGSGQPSVFPDGAGGACYVWADANRALRLQHVRGDGSLIPGADPQGTVVLPQFGGPDLASYLILQDRSGGAYVLYDSQDNGDGIVIMIRIDANGAPLWKNPIRVSFPELGRLTGWTAVSSPTGGVIAGFFTFFDFGEVFIYDGYLNSVLPDGHYGSFVSLNFVFPEPAILGATLIPSATDGVFVRLADGSTTHLDDEFLPTWPMHPPTETHGTLWPDDVGGVYVVEFEGFRPIVRRLTNLGAPPTGWPSAGVQVNGHVDIGREFDIVPTTLGLLMAWNDLEDSSLKAIRVPSDGFAEHEDGGSAISVAPSRAAPAQPGFVQLDSGRALLWWVESSKRSPSSIQAGKFVAIPRGRRAAVPEETLAGTSGRTDLGGPERLELDLSSAIVEDGTLRARGHLDPRTDAVLEVIDVSGRSWRHDAVSDVSGNFSRSFALRGMPSGIYWARLTQSGRSVAAKFVLARFQ
jgi:hypothetical protein